MKRSQPKRDWRDANEQKRGPCRVCGEPYNVELAHLVGREFDPKRGSVRYVRPDSIVPLCGPSTDTTTCHGLQHAGLLDLIPHTTKEEQACAVLDIGLYSAYVKLGAISRAERAA